MKGNILKMNIFFKKNDLAFGIEKWPWISKVSTVQGSVILQILLSTFYLAINELILNPACVKFTTQLTIIYLTSVSKNGYKFATVYKSKCVTVWNRL